MPSHWTVIGAGLLKTKYLKSIIKSIGNVPYPIVDIAPS